MKTIKALSCVSIACACAFCSDYDRVDLCDECRLPVERGIDIVIDKKHDDEPVDNVVACSNQVNANGEDYVRTDFTQYKKCIGDVQAAVFEYCDMYRKYVGGYCRS